MRRLALLLLAACAPVPDEPTDLVHPEDWAPVIAEDDPFPDRPDHVWCPPNTWGAEALTFEVQTGACSYFTAEQPLLVDLPKGATVEVVMWHDALDAAEPGDGHAAIQLGDLHWDYETAIPAPSRVVVEELVLDRRLHAGDPVHFHVHNHGYNSWQLVSLRWVVPTP